MKENKNQVGVAVFKNIRDFTGLYSLSKTLRFELIPQGKTKENIEKGGLIVQDEERADDYKKVKKIIDKYHKWFISFALDTYMQNGVDLELLNKYYDCYIDLTDAERKAKLEEYNKSLRQDFEKNGLGVAYNKLDKGKDALFGKELIESALPKFLNSEGCKQELDLIAKFKGFTTYFTGFNENRANIYSNEGHVTEVGYRLFNDNLPKFIDNIENFKKVEKTFEDKIVKINEDLQEELVILNVSNVKELFRIDSFPKTMSQKRIDAYNTIIGGKVFEDGKKIQGLNEYINLHNQVHGKNERLPRFRQLFKQILSDREKLSFIPESFDKDQEVLDSVNGLYDEIKGSIGELKQLLINIDNYNLDRIFVSQKERTFLSESVCKSWSALNEAILLNFEEKEGSDVEFKKREKLIDDFLKQDFSLKDLSSFIANVDRSDLLFEIKEKIQKLFEKITTSYEDVKPILLSNSFSNARLASDENRVFCIKSFLDALKEFQRFVKIFSLDENYGNRDMNFYVDFDQHINAIEAITLIYNKVRNYLTSKPYSLEKFKLNFENASLLTGWDINKENDYKGVLFRKDGDYYLGIINKKSRKIFDDMKTSDNKQNAFEKFDFKLVSGANKMISKVCFAKCNANLFNVPDEIYEIKKEESFKTTSSNFDIDKMHTYVNFFKGCIQKYEGWKNFDFKFSDTSSYRTIADFYNEFDRQAYKVTSRYFSADYIDELVQSGDLYLFQIYNKDYSPYSTGNKNLHTLYWEALFDKFNIEGDRDYRLGGNAEIFFRKKSIFESDRIIHKKNEELNNKNSENPKKTSLFKYDLIKDRRFTVDKFQFHVPIALNKSVVGRSHVNNNVLEFIKSSPDCHIIGIDRGERHLLYVSVINLKGEIIEQFSLNEIINEVNTKDGSSYQVSTDYHELLNKKELERKVARVNWSAVNNIKELKEGYMSQVVHKITELMLKYNAIVVLEDLNFGFKQGRQKVEKNVYQKFESMLINKLNFFVDKSEKVDMPAGIFKPLQLSNQFESFKKLGKQSGFLFYVPAWNTSKIDPVTGFVNFFDLRYVNIERSIEFFKGFDDIRYNTKENYFEFSFDYNKFTKKAEKSRSKWTVCSHGNRLQQKQVNNIWETEEIDPTKMLKDLFDKFEVDYIADNLKEQICQRKDKEFFSSLLFCLKMVLQIRNSRIGQEEDYLISSVKDEKSNFYDSRKVSGELPNNGDANGAYNIARKGLMLVERIKGADLSKKVDLKITNEDFLKFVQKC